MQRDLRTPLTFTLLTILALAACSSSSSTDGSATADSGSLGDTGTTGGGDGATNRDSGAPSDAGTAADSASGLDAAPTSDGGGGVDSSLANDSGSSTDSGVTEDGGAGAPGAGFVTVNQQTTHAGTMTFISYSVSASFSLAQGPTGCVVTPVGGCLVINCPPNASSPAVSAGDITVSGGQLAVPIMLMPNGANMYMASGTNMRAYNPGDMIHIVAAGAPGGVLAFDETLTAPSDVTITAPAFTLGQPVAINRMTDLTVSWTAGANATGEVSVVLIGPSGGGMNTVVETCRYPATLGTATISAATLGMIPAGSGVISIRADTAMTIMPGNFQVQLLLSSSAGTPNDAPSASQATFR